MAEAGNRQFYSAHLKVEFIVDLELPNNDFFHVYYKFPTKDFPNWKRLSHESSSSEFFDDLKQACITERMEEQ